MPRFAPRNLPKEAAELAAMDFCATLLYHCTLAVHSLIVLLGIYGTFRVAQTAIATSPRIGSSSDDQPMWWSQPGAFAVTWCLCWIPAVGIQRCIFKSLPRNTGVPCRLQRLAREQRDMAPRDMRWAKDIYLLNEWTACRVVLVSGTLYGIATIALVLATLDRVANAASPLALLNGFRAVEIGVTFGLIAFLCTALGLEIFG